MSLSLYIYVYTCMYVRVCVYIYMTSGMTFADWLIVTRYFSVAASIAIAWVAAGTALSSIYLFY